MPVKKTRKKKSKKSSKNTKIEKVSEYFEVERGGKEKIIKATGKVEEKKESKNQVKEQNKILIGVFIVVGILIISGVAYSIYAYNKTNFTHNGTNFKLVKEGDLHFYNAIIPVIGPNSQKIDYNIYTRNDPRELEKEVPFQGQTSLKQVLILNATNDFVCEGHGAISIANLANVYSILGTKVLKDQNASCDPQARYAYLLLTEGETNQITQVGEACYTATIKDCEILKVTERFIYETLKEINKK